MFRYWKEPLCWGSCLAYVLNRMLLKPAFHSAFLRGYFNDLLLIPCALPLVLWLHRRLGLRPHDAAPQWREIAFHLVVWSVLFEALGPHLMRGVTGDPWDVVAYCVGGIVSGWWWQRSDVPAA